jgi:hypothetical protein
MTGEVLGLVHSWRSLTIKVGPKDFVAGKQLVKFGVPSHECIDVQGATTE